MPLPLSPVTRLNPSRITHLMRACIIRGAVWPAEDEANPGTFVPMLKDPWKIEEVIAGDPVHTTGWHCLRTDPLPTVVIVYRRITPTCSTHR
jgi:hypothetical protein